MERPPTAWYQNAIFYEVYPRAFYDSNRDGKGDLRGLTQKLKYLQWLGVDCIWLTPIYPSPMKDDGYDISSYIEVHPDFGTLTDFQNLVKAVHRHKMRIVMDLVVNHTSDQHPWFQSAHSDPGSPYRDYYVWSDTDELYNDARIIFKDTETSNWTWDGVAGKYFWHRFYSSQPDLNYDNPMVRAEMLRVMDFWLSKGIDGFRVDAVPYLFEREGTNCENLPETHAYLKEMRRYVDEHYPGALLLCEANQWPEDVRQYFGDGDEFQMGFHFPVMPRIFMAIRKGEVDPIRNILDRTPEIPEGCQWCTFLRNHDELTLEMVTEEERQWMWNEYAPDPRMRLNLGIRRRLAPLLDNDRRRIELANSLLFTLPGSPIIYYGDEIGMGDNIYLPDRNGVRTPMQWTSISGTGFSMADPEHFFSPVIQTPPFDPAHVNVISQQENDQSLLHTIRGMLAVRKAHPVFAQGKLSWVDCGTNAVAGYLRHDDHERVLVLNNLSSRPQNVVMQLERPDQTLQVDLLNHECQIQRGVDGNVLFLEPYQYLWLAL
jgi:maltose alpha-D-glucosyltransferase/alpha-amylase